MGRHSYNEQSSVNQNFPHRNDNNSSNSNGAGQASAFENGNNHRGNLNLSAWSGGGHNLTSVDGPEKIALRSMEEGYFVPACVGNLPLTFFVDTGSNVTNLCQNPLDS